VTNDETTNVVPDVDEDAPISTRRPYGWAARTTAIGFIAVIAFGNFWLSHALFGTLVPDWVGIGFVVGMSVAAIGGIGLAGGAAWRWIANASPKDQ
jgi:hypothetical protein